MCDPIFSCSVDKLWTVKCIVTHNRLLASSFSVVASVAQPLNARPEGSTRQLIVSRLAVFILKAPHGDLRRRHLKSNWILYLLVPTSTTAQVRKVDVCHIYKLFMISQLYRSSHTPNQQTHRSRLFISFESQLYTHSCWKNMSSGNVIRFNYRYVVDTMCDKLGNSRERNVV